MRIALGCCGLYQHADAFRDGLVFTIPSRCVSAFEMKTSCLAQGKYGKKCRKPAISAIV